MRISPGLSLALLALPLSGRSEPPAAASPLRERAPVAAEPAVATAQALSASWVALRLPEIKLDPAILADPARFTVTSSDDPAFAKGVHPVAVHERHRPESAPYAPLTGRGANVAHLQVISRVHLQLPKALRPGAHYRVRVAAAKDVPPALDFTFGRGVVSEAIQANQEAYAPDGPKVGFLSYWTGQGALDFADVHAFSVVDAKSGAAVFTGQVVQRAAAENEPWSRANVYALDFSAFRSEGTFRLEVPGVGASLPFRISRDAFTDLAYTLVRGLTLQRDGAHGLTPAVTHWSRPAAHLDDAVEQSSGKRVDLAGGHMDAGDRGHYPHDAADTAVSLLAAMQLFPEQVAALGETLQIPESGNGVPDLVDEVVYELDWLQKAVENTSKDGAVSFMLRPANGGYEQGVGPEGAKGRVYFDVASGPARSETLYTAGALAMAANTPVLCRALPAKCVAYRGAALKAFAAFEAHASEPKFWNERGWYDPWTAGPHPWSDELLVAAANLLELTGEERFAEWIGRELPADLNKVRLWSWGLGGPWLPAYLALSRGTRPQLSPELRRAAGAAIVAWGEAALAHGGHPYDRPFGTPLPWHVRERVGWYFTSAQTDFPLMLAYGLTGEAKYREQILTDWGYLLGANPLGRSYFTGLGDPQRRPRWLLHELSHAFAFAPDAAHRWLEPPPGLPLADIQDGHFPNYLDDAWNAARRTDISPPQDARYPILQRTCDGWISTNEFTVSVQARAIATVLPFVALPRK